MTLLNLRQTKPTLLRPSLQNWSTNGSTTASSGLTKAIIEGEAGSAASLAVLACDRIECHESAVFHPHYLLIMAMGHPADIRQALAIQERLDEDLEGLYADRSGRSIAQVQKDLLGTHGDGTRFSAQQALDAGYVDHVIRRSKRPAAAQQRREKNLMTSRGATLMMGRQPMLFGLPQWGADDRSLPEGGNASGHLFQGVTMP